MAGKKSPAPPRPPFVEPGFYFAEHSSEEAFFLVVEHLLGRGASLSGSAVLGDAGDPDQLADLKLNQADTVSVHDLQDVRDIRRDKGRVVVGVTLAGVEPGSAGREVHVRMLPIPQDAVGQDRHPIAVWCDGRAFEPDSTAAAKKRSAGKLLELFVSIVTALHPSYGSILFSWPLPSPNDVASRPDGFEFADFYLSADYIGQTALERVTRAVDSEHRRPLDRGSLFLTSGVFAPAPEKNDDVGRLAAQAIAARS